MRLAFGIALLACGACDNSLFDIDHVGPGSDGAVDTPIDGEPCPASYVALANSDISTSVYRFELESLGWFAAESRCENETMTRISHLVVFDSLDELFAVRSLGPSGGWSAHAGYSRASQGDPKTFYSVTGDMITDQSLLWDTGGSNPEPNNVNLTETTTFFKTDLRLADGTPGSPFYSVCECDGRRVKSSF